MSKEEFEKKLKSCTLEVLRNKCRALDIEPGDMTREQMMAQIVTEHENRLMAQEAREVRKDMAKADSKPKSAPAPDYQATNLEIPAPRCWFRVAEGSAPNDKGPVFMGLNGDSILIKRNQWVQLRQEFLPIFADAVITDVEIGLDGTTHIRQVPRYNYEVRSLSEGKPKEADLPRGF